MDQTAELKNKSKLSVALGIVWALAIILLILWVLCLKGNTDSALSKLNGQPNNLPSTAQDRDGQILSVSGTILTLSNGGSVDLRNLVGAPGTSGSDGANGTNGTNGSNGVNGAIGPIGPVGPPGPVAIPTCLASEVVFGNGAVLSCVPAANAAVVSVTAGNGLTGGGGPGAINLDVNPGVGISIVGDAVTNTGVLTTTASGPLSSTGGQNPDISLIACAANQLYLYNGATWACTNSSAIPVTNALSWTKAGGVTSTVNGVVANQPAPVGTLLDIVGYDAAGNPANQNVAALLAANTTNTLVNNGINTLTSTVNGVASAASIVNSVANSSIGNVLGTTVNGVAGANVSIINSNAVTLNQATGLTTTVNGIASNQAIGAVAPTQLLGFDGGGNVVFDSVANILAANTTNTLLNNGTNTLTSTVNGVASAASVVNSVSNTSAGNNLSTTVNGVVGANVLIINSNSLVNNGTNTLTSTVNGIATNDVIINTVVDSWTKAGGLTTTVNGVAGNFTPAAGTIADVLGYDALGNPVSQSLATLPCDPTGQFACNNGNTLGADLTLGTNDGNNFVLETNGVEAGRIDAAGNFGLGVVPSGTYELEQRGQLLLEYDVPASTRKQFITTGDDVTAPTGLNLGVEGTGFISQDTANPNVLAYLYASITGSTSMGYQDVTTGTGSQQNLAFTGWDLSNFDGLGNGNTLSGSNSNINFSSSNTVTGDSNFFMDGDVLQLLAQNLGAAQSSFLNLIDSQLWAGIANGTSNLRLTGTTLSWDREAQLLAYPSTRDDSGSFAPVNFLYTDAGGNVLSAPTSALASLDCTLSTTIFCQGGNSFGTPGVLGTNDAQDLYIRTNGGAGGIGNGTIYIGDSASAAIGNQVSIGTNYSGADTSYVLINTGTTGAQAVTRIGEGQPTASNVITIGQGQSGTGLQQIDIGGSFTSSGVQNINIGSNVAGSALSINSDNLQFVSGTDIERWPTVAGTAGQVLTTDGAGTMSWQSNNALFTADNGLTVNPAGNVQLGGTLIQNTQVDQAGFDMTFNNGNFYQNRSNGLSTFYIENSATTIGGDGIALYETTTPGVFTDINYAIIRDSGILLGSVSPNSSTQTSLSPGVFQTLASDIPTNGQVYISGDATLSTLQFNAQTLSSAVQQNFDGTNGAYYLLVNSFFSPAQMQINPTTTGFTFDFGGQQTFQIANNSRVVIGEGTGNIGFQTIKLELDNKTSAGDPAGANGQMYYNASDNKFRCFENGTWVNCLDGAITTADNALTLTGNNVQLGGALLQNTTVTNNGFNFIFNGTGNGSGKIATFAGDVDIQGVIDPTAILFSDSGTGSYNPATTNGFKIGTTGATNRPVYVSNSLNSTNTFQVRQADDTTVVFNVDTLNQRVGVRTATPGATLDIQSTESTATALNVAANSITTGNGLAITSNAVTSGDILNISSSSAGAFGSDGAVQFLFSGNHTGNLFVIDDGTSTAGNVQIVSANALTTGTIMGIFGDAVTSGDLLNINSNSAGNFGADGAVDFNFTGNHTGNAVRILSATTTGTLLNLSDSSLTTGTALAISAGTFTTGSAISITATGGAGILSNTPGNDLTTPAGNTLNVVSGTTGSASFDSGTTGAVNVGNGAGSKTITIGNVTGATAVNFNTGTTGVAVNTDAVTTGNALAISTAGLTTGTGISVTGNALTGGSLLRLNTSSTGNFTNGAFFINASATHTGTAARITSSSLTGTGLGVTANALTTGNAVTISTNNITSGNAINISSTSASRTGAAGTAGVGLLTINGTGSNAESISITDSTNTCTGNPGATMVFTCTSDATLKHNINDAEDVLNKLTQIQIRQYDWNSDNTHERYGVVAQEVENTDLSYLVKTNVETGIKSVREVDNLMIVKGLQEVNTKVDVNKIETSDGITGLSTQIATNTQEIQVLKDQLAELSTQGINTTSSGDVQMLQTLLSQQGVTITQLSTDLQALLTRVEQVEAKNTTQDERIQKLEDEINALKTAQQATQQASQPTP